MARKNSIQLSDLIHKDQSDEVRNAAADAAASRVAAALGLIDVNSSDDELNSSCDSKVTNKRPGTGDFRTFSSRNLFGRRTSSTRSHKGEEGGSGRGITNRTLSIIANPFATSMLFRKTSRVNSNRDPHRRQSGNRRKSRLARRENGERSGRTRLSQQLQGDHAIMLKKVYTRRASIFDAEDVRHSTSAWALCLVIGVSVGVVDGFMVETLSWLAELKHDLLASAIEVSLPVAGIVMFAFCAALTFAVMFTVVKCAPMASGSGLSEIKALLNGSNIPGLVDIRTGVVKCLGIMGTMTAGLALGREGPMVHIGTALAAFWLRVPYFQKRIVEPHIYRRAQSVINVKAEDLNLYLTIGGAAGVAAAFNAPITGVIYMLEEMASYWPTWMTVQAFACTAFAAVTMQVINYGYDNVGGDTNALLHPKGVVLATNWKGRDMIMFVVLGLLAGLFSTMLIICCKFVFSLRATLMKWYKIKFIAFDVLLLTALAVTTFVFLPLAFQCKPDPTYVAHRQLPAVFQHQHQHQIKEIQAQIAQGDFSNAAELQGLQAQHSPLSDVSGHRQLTVSADPHHLQHTCGEGKYNPMADFTQGNSEHLVVTLWTEGVHYDKAILGVFLAVYAIQFMLLPGIKLPIGTFAPCLLMGALLGRLVGEVLHDSNPGYWADPGVFSQVAAGAMLSGYTHMALTITAIIIEASGASDLVVPVCVTVLVSRSVSVKMAGHILDDFQMVKKKLYFLYNSVPESVRSKLAKDVMLKRSDEKFITCGMSISPLKTLSVLTKNMPLDGTPVLNAFPVVAHDHVVGVVSTQLLMNALKNDTKHRRDIEGGTMSQVVQMVIVQQREQRQREQMQKEQDQQGISEATSPVVSSLRAMKRRSFRGSKGSPTLKANSPRSEKDEDATEPVTKNKRIQRFVSSMSAQSLNVAGMMDAAPILFMEKTPVNRIYTAFIRMNLEMVCIVDEHQKLKGVITRKMLIEYSGSHSHDHESSGILYNLDYLRNSMVWFFEKRLMDCEECAGSIVDSIYSLKERCCPATRTNKVRPKVSGPSRIMGSLSFASTSLSILKEDPEGSVSDSDSEEMDGLDSMVSDQIPTRPAKIVNDVIPVKPASGRHVRAK